MNFNYQAAFVEPIFKSYISTWMGHLPFAAWITTVMRPSIFVELGTYAGGSYLTFCQTIKKLNLHTRAYAVDTWCGDAHNGFYGDNIYLNLQRLHDPLYGGFSSLLKMTFDEALLKFENGSVDLLHIDGFHSYDAVKHDFETWLPKMSSKGVVMLHDTNVYDRNFGVHQLYAELSKQYPCFNFKHSYGLGVVLVGAEQKNPQLFSLTDPTYPNEAWHEAEYVFRFLGTEIENKCRDADQLNYYKERIQFYENEMNSYKSQIQSYEEQIKLYAAQSKPADVQSITPQ